MNYLHWFDKQQCLFLYGSCVQETLEVSPNLFGAEAEHIDAFLSQDADYSQQSHAAVKGLWSHDKTLQEDQTEPANFLFSSSVAAFFFFYLYVFALFLVEWNHIANNCCVYNNKCVLIIF